MHIPNAVLDPKVAAATGLIGAVGLGYALRALERRAGEGAAVKMGTTAAFVFSAQMVNFPLGPLGVSGHLIGGVLAAVMVGPYAGSVVLAAVLIVQCFLFGDGGLTALGANFTNMGLIGAVGGYAIYAPIRRAIGGRRGVVVGAMAAAWFSVILAAAAFSVELAASGRWSEFVRVLGWMTLVHAAIGLGEALITGLALRFILQVRPDLVYEPTTETGSPAPLRWWQTAVAGLGVSLAVCVFLAPWASEHPDGLEFVGTEKVKFIPGESPSILPVPIPGYDAGPLTGLTSVKAATAVAGVIGTLAVFGVALGLSGVFAGRSPSNAGATTDAA